MATFSPVYPLMTSFKTNLTCKQVWEHLWTLVADHLPDSVDNLQRGKDTDARADDSDGANPAEQSMASDDDNDNDDPRKRWVRVRIVDNQSVPQRVFPTANGQKVSLLPYDSNEQVRTFLGKDCADRFLFVSLEWSFQSRNETKRFVSVTNHATYVEGRRQQQQQQQQGRSKTGVTLDQCLDTFTRPERLDENNKWYCNKCKEHVRAMKTMELWRLPNILVIHLKRFEFKGSLRRDKLDTFVDYPLEGLDMSKHCTKTEPTVDDTVPAVYDLFGVTNHFGRLGFGHYTAFCRRWNEHGLESAWSLFDDSTVRPVGDGTNSVVTPAGYVLFYRRRNFH